MSLWSFFKTFLAGWKGPRWGSQRLPLISRDVVKAFYTSYEAVLTSDLETSQASSISHGFYPLNSDGFRGVDEVKLAEYK